MRHLIIFTIVTILNIGGVSSNTVQCSEVASEERDGWCDHWDTRIVRNYTFAETDTCTTLDLCGKCVKSSSVLEEPTDCCTNPNDKDANGCMSGKEYWNGTECKDVTVCENNEYQTNIPNTDRICVALTTCDPGTRVLNTSSATEDRTCAACANGKFSDQANQQSCSSWATCGNNEYQTNTHSATEDRICVARTTCVNGTRVTNTPSATENRICAACAPGKFSVQQNQESCISWTTT